MARHFDKVLLALAIALLALTVLRDAVLNRDRDVMAVADAAIRDSRTAGDAYRKAAQALHGGYDARALWTAPAQGPPLKPWSGSQAPRIEIREVDVDPTPPPLETRLPAAQIQSLKAGVAAVRVAIKVTPAVESPGVRAVKATSLRLQRRSSGDWADVATLDPTTPSHDDAAIEPKTSYEYRVSAGGPWSAPVAVTTPSHVSWRPRGSCDGRATVRISVYVPSRAKTYEVPLSNGPGERIGSVPVGDPDDGVRTTKHRLPDGLEIDLDTGVDLRSIGIGAITVVENGVERIVKYR